MKTAAVLALLATATLPAAANATQHFNLSGIVFANGGTITGSFDTDNAFTTVTNWSVTTGAGTVSCDFICTPTATSGFAYSMSGGFIPMTATLSATSIFFSDGLPYNTLRLDFSRPLSNGSATITGGIESQGFLPYRTVAAGGSITNPNATAAVPEPATWALMIAGFGMVGAGLRRRRVAVRFA